MIRVNEFLDKYATATSDNLIKAPRISIIMPTYCRGDNGLLARAILSVLSQSFKNFELIIVDDGAKDSTKKIVGDFLNKITVLSI